MLKFALNMVPKPKTEAVATKKLYARKPISQVLARFGRKTVRKKKAKAPTTTINGWN